jgi:hypothetical protein
MYEQQNEISRQQEAVEGGELTPAKITTETRVLVKPELYRQMIAYLPNSIPKSYTVAEVAMLIEQLKTTSIESQITFN